MSTTPVVNHIVSQCPYQTSPPTQDKQACAFSTYKPPTANTFENTYHPDIHSHPNFSWRQIQLQMQRPNASGFNHHRLNLSQFHQNNKPRSTATHGSKSKCLSVQFPSYNQTLQLTQFDPLFNQF